MNIELRDVDYVVYHFIFWYKSGHDGNSPTVREIGHHIGSSTSHVFYILNKLERFGMIKRERFTSRGITIIKES